MLKEWAKTYFLNKDILRGNKPTVEEKHDYILITNQDKSHVILIVKEQVSELSSVMKRFQELEKEHNAEKLTLVLYNKKENVDLIVKSWAELIKNPKLTVVLANPHTNNKWVLTPHIHNKIADIKNLKNGLLSMYGSVEPVFD
ncbi:hypothetical protein KY311_04890 [Candidatus Woesearchaeota archaeon]|nr:hypothetical protein [Candidatus Woesearchaeota archaeon]